MGRCSNAKRYAASARLSLAIEKSLEGFTRIRGPGHAATASLAPSKPVAPVLTIYPAGTRKSTKNGPELTLSALRK